MSLQESSDSTASWLRRVPTHGDPFCCDVELVANRWECLSKFYFKGRAFRSDVLWQTL